MQRERLLVALVLVPLSLAAIFYFSAAIFFLFCLTVLTGAAWELARMLRRWTPGAPLGLLLLLVPVTATGIFLILSPELTTSAASGDGAMELVVGATLLVLVAGGAVLLGRTPEAEAAAAMGFLTFGSLYFALPAVALARLQASDPWLVVALCAVVWLGDSAAYYVGSRLGRLRLAPRVSPNKTWEGAAASFLAGLGAAVVWSELRLGRVDGAFLAVAAVAAVAAQIGDLVESLLKRGAGVKDSSRLLPGHGGLYDRMDAMLLAAPVFWLGLWLLDRL